MMKSLLPLTIALAAGPAFAEDTRELDAHIHGVGELNIALDGNEIAMELHAPGADIVGFEYEPKTDEDKAKIDAGLAALSKPLDLFKLPADAGCSITSANAELESEGAHDDHDEHAKEDGHDDHDHDEHAKEDGHDDHDHDEHAKEDGHDDHDHEEHADEAGHTEFHAEYAMTCTKPDALTSIEFAYFNIFENALEVDVQAVGPKGAQAFEVTRDAPVLDLSSMF